MSTLNALLAVLVIHTALAGSDILYVSHSGRDATGCGPVTSPCATLRYASSNVSLSSRSVKIYVDSAEGPYTNEGGVSYISVTGRLEVVGVGSQIAIIQCTSSNRSKLFHINGTSNDRLTPNSIAMVSLTLKNMAVFGCQGDGGVHGHAIEIFDASLTISNCTFSNNGLFLRTSRSTSCQLSSVNILNSVFHENFASKPSFQHGVALVGCSDSRLSVVDSVLFSTPVLVHSGNTTDLQIVRTVINGSSVRGSSVSVILRGTGGVSRLVMTDSTVGGHTSSRESAMSISVIGRQFQTVSITINRCHFIRNVHQKTRGGALSVVAKSLSSEPPKAVTVNLHLSDCEFVENSANDLGGSLYIAFISSVRLNKCMFRNNSGLEGGAVYLLSTNDVSVTSSWFFGNQAASPVAESFAARGGAIMAVNSNLQIIQCNLTGNQARFAGSAMYLEHLVGVNLTSNFVSEPLGQSSANIGPDNSLVEITAVDPKVDAPNVQLTLNTFVSYSRHDHSLLYIRAQTTAHNITVQCSAPGDSSMKNRQLSEKAPYGAGYQLQRLAVWCEASCPPGFYSVEGSGGRKLVEFNDQECSSSDEPCSRKGRLPGVAWCHPCPEHTSCSGGRPKADVNYYGYRRSSGDFEAILCPLGYCEPDINSSEPSCAASRAGLLCAECAEGTTPVVDSVSPVLCRTSECLPYSSLAVFAVSFAAMFFVLLLMAHKLTELISSREDSSSSYRPLQSSSDGTNRAGSRPVRQVMVEHLGAEAEREYSSSMIMPPPRDQSTGQTAGQTGHLVHKSDCSPLSSSLSSNSVIACVLSVAFFYQLLPVVFSRLSTSTGTVDRVVNVVVELFQLIPPFSSFGGVCIYLEMSSVSASRYFLVVSFFWFQSALIIVLFASIAIFFRLVSGPFGEQNIKMLTTHFGSAQLFAIVIYYVPVVRTSLDSFSCTSVNDSLVVYTDTSTMCYQPWQQFSIFYFVACIAPFCLVLDSGAFQLSRGRISVRTYVVYCLFPVLGLFLIPITNAFHSVREWRSTGNRCFVVDASVPPGLRTVSTHVVVVVQSLLIRPYRKFFSSPLADFGWLTVVLVRNFVLCLFGSLLVGHPTVRGVILVVICVFFAIDHVCFQSLSSTLANRWETLLVFILAVLSVLNLVSAVVYESSASSASFRDMSAVLDWIGLVLALLPVTVASLALGGLALTRCFRWNHNLRRCARPL